MKLDWRSGVAVAAAASTAVVIVALTLASATVSGADIVDFSPDSRLVVAPVGPTSAPVLAIARYRQEASDAMLRFVPDGKNPTWVNWSPDGASILFGAMRNGEPVAKLYRVTRDSTTTLNGAFTAPTAWREDGRQFAAILRTEDGTLQLVQYSLTEERIVNQSQLPVEPAPHHDLVWLPGADSIAYLGLDKNIHIIEAGKARKITTSDDVIGLGLRTGGKELVWAGRGQSPGDLKLSLHAWDISKRTVRKLPYPDRVTPLNPPRGTELLSVDAVTFAPDGRYIALRATTTAPLAAPVNSKQASKQGPLRVTYFMVGIGSSSGSSFNGSFANYVGGTGHTYSVKEKTVPAPNEQVEGAWSPDGNIFAQWRNWPDAHVLLLTAFGDYYRRVTAKGWQ